MMIIQHHDLNFGFRLYISILKVNFVTRVNFVSLINVSHDCVCLCLFGKISEKKTNENRMFRDHEIWIDVIGFNRLIINQDK